MQIDAHIRWMLRRDLEEVLAIETACFEFPWTVEQFVNTLHHRDCIGYVAEHEERIVGYMLYEMNSVSVRILNLAVHPCLQGHTVGKQMIEKLTDKLSRKKRHKLTCEVRESNLDAQLFLRACGLQAVEVLNGFYIETTEDAYRFEYSLLAKPVNRVGVYLGATK